MLFTNNFTTQGHRGARGYLPENTIQSCCRAIELGADGLEVDVCVSADKQIIVSHEPFMSRLICSFPDGKPVNTEGGLLLKNMTAREIQQFDCGSRGNARFSTQQPVKCFKPTLYELVSGVHTFCELRKLPQPFWNIEVKSHPKWYGRLVPKPSIFCTLLKHPLSILPKNGFYVSSFDPFFLRVLRREMPKIPLAFLTEHRETFSDSCKRLGFSPTIYSPFYKNITTSMVENVHKRGVKLMTWTVNDAATMRRLKNMGVDGIITDFPDSINFAKFRH
ncbi:MAG: glycerophosphodiester phosphodiesterase family protein [Saprospiraceae bacterium]|nr:glycerophosphodiester phosphodiesterase family protein [Saprospiraceae bacterium]